MRTRPALGLISGLVLILVAVGSTGVFAQETEPELVPADSTFFLRGTGCGATEQLWLSIESGPDAYDGCGVIGGLPVQEVFYQVDGPLPSSFPAQDGVPAIIDASRNVTGTIRAESWFGDGVPGIGQVIVDVTLYGFTAKGLMVPMGSDSVEVLNTGSTTGTQVDFTLDVPDAAQQVEVSELTFEVEIHGLNWNSGNLGLEGDSRFVLPVLVPDDTEAPVEPVE